MMPVKVSRSVTRGVVQLGKQFETGNNNKTHKVITVHEFKKQDGATVMGVQYNEVTLNGTRWQLGTWSPRTLSNWSVPQIKNPRQRHDAGDHGLC